MTAEVLLKSVLPGFIVNKAFHTRSFSELRARASLIDI